MPELLAAAGIRHRFRDGGLGLDGACLSVMEGDFLVLAGRNGAGKSLLARHLAGIKKAQEGDVLFRGEAVRGNLGLLRSNVGLVFQDAQAQVIGQTLKEDAAFGPANLGLSRAEAGERAGEALRSLGLDAMGDRNPESLSGGELRRLAIAGVLAMRPECLILDEPFANLDYPSIRSVLSALLSLRDGGRTIIVLTHEIEKILAHATRLAVMDSGRIAYQGDPDGVDSAFLGRHGLHDPYRRRKVRADLSWLEP